MTQVTQYIFIGMREAIPTVAITKIYRLPPMHLHLIMNLLIQKVALIFPTPQRDHQAAVHLAVLRGRHQVNHQVQNLVQVVKAVPQAGRVLLEVVQA